MNVVSKIFAQKTNKLLKWFVDHRVDISEQNDRM